MEAQPGREHAMDPSPQPINPHYIPSNKLHGKVALVIGGDSGVGRAVCYNFAQEGATVAFTYLKDREENDTQDTLRMIREIAKTTGTKDPVAIPVTDLGYDASCSRLVDEVVDLFGHIDILVNHAAQKHMTNSIEEISEEQLDRVFRTNIFSCFFVTRHALKHMKEGSSIINTASVDPYIGSPKFLDYSSACGAIVAFTRGLALQLVHKGIRVNAVAPGPVWSPQLPADMIASYGSEAPMKRVAETYEMAPAFLFLADNQCSSYITGQVIHPNGGIIINA